MNIFKSKPEPSTLTKTGQFVVKHPFATVYGIYLVGVVSMILSNIFTKKITKAKSRTLPSAILLPSTFSRKEQLLIKL